MENIILELSGHELDILLRGLELAIESTDDDDEKVEYEDVMYLIQKEVDEEYNDELE